MHPFLWPQRTSETGVLVRIGRMIHWMATGLGVAVALFAVTVVIARAENRPESLRAIADWDRRHPSGTVGPDEYDYRPYEVQIEPEIILWCAIGGLGLSLAGRGLRYVLADE